MKSPLDLPQLLAFIAMLQGFGDAQGLRGFFSGATKLITKEVSDVTNPVASGISYIGNSQSKNIVGLFNSAKQIGDTKDVATGITDIGKSQSQNVLGLVNTATKQVKQEVADAKNPIATGISYVGSSQCGNVKKLVGVDYEQMKDGQEPDVDNLTLNFISPNVRTTYHLRSVATELPLVRGLSNTKMVLFMHGFTDSPEKGNFQLINKAFQDIGHHCILALDASPLLKYLYLRSSTYVRFIGEKLGEVLAALHIRNGIHPQNFHLIGHSLGAHISSFAAKRFQQLTGLLVGRVTGLDPAGPCFSTVDPDLRLKSTDAVFVDAIHTDGGVYGLSDPVGQADYFPNGGSQQPNCLLETCSHSRVVKLFAESIYRPDGFPALRCDSYDHFKESKCSSQISFMGLAATPGTQGLFYLQTNDTKPFALGKAGIRYVNRDGIVKSITNVAALPFKG